MKEIKNGGVCPLTGWEIVSDIIEDNGYRYDIKCARYFFTLWVTTECCESSALVGLQHIIRWLLFNGKIKTVETHVDKQNLEFVYSEDRLLNLIEETFIPRTPNEKAGQLLVLLNKIFPWFCGEIERRNLFNLTFFPSEKEFDIYISHFINSGYISKLESNKNVVISGILIRETVYSIDITFKGIEYLASIVEHGRNSRNCFVAMSFSGEKELEIKEAIKAALKETNYNPIIINEQHFESDRTINDEIIAGIKKAKFVISDFTEQKPNVYFEAGFALGLGLPVIYCCEKEDFDNHSHFDVNHYPHILYKTPEQLSKGLIDKIRAWID
ncbi:MAG: nucleotide-binding protein [Prolixibacteraceae bacterium]|nr:nucleotide-binding protein [Prolixibacteraceae bacterium]